MATLNTHFPAASRGIRRLLAVGVVALASSFGFAALAPDGANATHTGTNTTAADPSDAPPPRFGCAFAAHPPSPTNSVDDNVERDRAEAAVRCLVNHWRTDPQAPAADRFRDCAIPVLPTSDGNPATDDSKNPCRERVPGARLQRTRPSGLRALGHRSTLRLAARRFSADMAQYNYFPSSHIGRDGSNPATRMDAAGYCGTPMAENASQGIGPGTSWHPNSGATPLSVVERWRDPAWTSAGHRATFPRNGHWENILTTSANEHGVGMSFGFADTDPNNDWDAIALRDFNGQAAVYTQDFGFFGGTC